jgi:branched-chain amino acid transport system substrate-binding protein
MLSTSTVKAEEKEPIKIGLVMPFTGPLAHHGEQEARGIRIATKQRNAAGGIQGRKIVLVERDGKDTDTAIAQVEYLGNQGIPLGVGSMSSSITYGTSAKANTLGMIWWCNACIANDITDRRLPNTWRAHTTSSDFGYVGADAAKLFVAPLLGKEPKQLKVAAVYEDGLWGTTASAFFVKRCAEYGMHVVATEPYDKSTIVDFTPQILRLKRAEPDLLYQIAYESDGLLFYEQSKALDFYVSAVISSGGVLNLTFAKKMGKAAEGILAANSPGINANPETCPGIYEFIQTHWAEYGEEPWDDNTLLSWYMQHLLYDILERTELPITVESFAKAAVTMDIPDNTTPLGYGLKFDPVTHQNIRSRARLQQWQPDRRTDDIYHRERSDGTLDIYDVWPSEWALPGVKVTGIPLPPWKDRPFASK